MMRLRIRRDKGVLNRDEFISFDEWVHEKDKPEESLNYSLEDDED